MSSTLTALLVIHCYLTTTAYWELTHRSNGLISQTTCSEYDDTLPPIWKRRKSVPSAEVLPGPVAIAKLQRTFPLHVGDDREEILHPGLLAMSPDAVQSWPEDLPHHLSVPMFFDDSHGWPYGGSIREYLGNGKHLMTPEQASAIGSKVLSTSGEITLETIFVSVASYRDLDCTATVVDLYERARYPERIRVAVVDQRMRESDDPQCAVPRVPCTENPQQTLCRYGHLIDRMEVDARYGCGPVFARHIAHRHYRGEYFALQIDAHIHFTEHWDTTVIEFWNSANNEMAVLSVYLSDVNGRIDPVTHASVNDRRPIMCNSEYHGSGEYRFLQHGKQPSGTAMITGQPTLEPFWAGGFSFSRGHFFIQVPYDQYLPILFQGEEISMGVRGFTYGYDYYTPERPVAFHTYAVKENEASRKKVPSFWENERYYGGVGLKSMRRLNTIIAMENFPRDLWVTDEVDKYGVGQVRNPNTFYDVFGIHVQEHRVEKNLCSFVGRPMMNAFLPALRKDRMGLDYDKIQFRFVDPNKNANNTKQQQQQHQQQQPSTLVAMK